MASLAINKIREAEKEAERIVDEARKSAELVISGANAEADCIVRNARLAASEYKKSRVVFFSKRISKRLLEVEERVRDEAERLRELSERRKREAIDRVIEIICN